MRIGSIYEVCWSERVDSESTRRIRCRGEDRQVHGANVVAQSCRSHSMCQVIRPNRCEDIELNEYRLIPDHMFVGFMPHLMPTRSSR